MEPPPAEEATNEQLAAEKELVEREVAARELQRVTVQQGPEAELEAEPLTSSPLPPPYPGPGLVSVSLAEEPLALVAHSQTNSLDSIDEFATRRSAQKESAAITRKAIWKPVASELGLTAQQGADADEFDLLAQLLETPEVLTSQQQMATSCQMAPSGAEVQEEPMTVQLVRSHSLTGALDLVHVRLHNLTFRTGSCVCTK